MNAWLTHTAEDHVFVYAPDARVAIALPLPLWSLQREQIAQAADGTWLSSQGKGRLAVYPFREVSAHPCRMPDVPRLRPGNPDHLEAFLFWSRAPFAERAPDGSVLIRDARYTDPRARDRFTVELKDVRCEPLKAPSSSEEGVGGGVGPGAAFEDSTLGRNEDTTPGPSSEEEGRR
jgi:inner membrane protein